MRQNIYKRKLSVIVSADVAGYAKLTELNETDIHGLLQKRLGLIRDVVTQYHGQLLRVHGDGCLCSFDSIVCALQACLEIQHAARSANSQAPEINQIWFRIGIHVSEVIVDASEQYGKGVNIAVRLQQNTKPGEITVSKEIIDLLGDDEQFIFSKEKSLKLKNISMKVTCFNLLGLSALSSEYKVDSLSRYSKIQSVAVFGFISLCVLNLLLVFYVFSDAEYDLISNDKIIEDENRFEIVKLEIDSSHNEGKLDKRYLVYKNEYTQNDEIYREKYEETHARLKAIEQGLLTIKREMLMSEDNINAQFSSISNAFYDLNDKVAVGVKIKSDTASYGLVNASEPYEFNTYDNHASEFESIYSSNYVTDSINLLDNSVQNKDLNRNVYKVKKDNFGCLSCMQTNSFMNYESEAEKSRERRNNAILIGKISGSGAQLLTHKLEVLENYLYTHLQASIKQSTLGAKIEKFTQIANQEEYELNDTYFEELCENKDAMIIASYELVTNRWSSEGTYLRFYHCEANKSVVHLEKNLAPTIMNVAKPYLTKDVWNSVDKSVDYLMDKLVVSRVEHL